MITVFVPTYRLGGLDVLEASLSRQIYQDFILIVADELFEKRWHIWDEISDRLNIGILPVFPEMKEGYKRNLCQAYNLAADLSVDLDAELMISLQDYIWLPEDGLEKFVDIAHKSPNDLITGLTSISKDPISVGEIAYSENSYYSIFPEPYTDKPKDIQWLDCRIDGVYEYYETDHCLQILPEHWEANWAAIPVSYFKYDIKWDEEFDKGIAYENMDFAKNAMYHTERRVIMDTTNHAISLPHKDYFSGESEEIIKYSNRKRYEDKWGS